MAVVARGHTLPTTAKVCIGSPARQTGENMKRELRKLARTHRQKGRQKAMLAMTILRMHRKDPKANDFLRHEAEPTLRIALYHLRQADILEHLAELATNRSH